jgi:hypothetical protein
VKKRSSFSDGYHLFLLHALALSGFGSQLLVTSFSISPQITPKTTQLEFSMGSQEFRVNERCDVFPDLGGVLDLW